jgi:excisionase family DNA binding protein
MTSTVQRRDDQSGRVTRKALYRIPEAMALLSVSRTVIYDQIRRGRLRSVKLGRTRLIPAAAIAEYVALLEQETGSWRGAA